MVHDAAETAASWSCRLIRYHVEMKAHALIRLLDGCFSGGLMAQRVQQLKSWIVPL